MSQQENNLTYNQIDFVIKAPKFRIAFSYTDGKGLSFICEYLLRLIRLAPCRPEKIAEYFDLSQKDTEIALEDLIEKQFVEYHDDGTISLTERGEVLFKNESGEPRLTTLKEKNADCCLELVGENFLEPKNISDNGRMAIEITATHEKTANSKDIVARNFQNRFLELKDDEIIEFEDSNSAELYKIDDVNIYANKYFRFTQTFSLDKADGNQQDRSDIQGVRHTDLLEQSVTDVLAQYRRANNLKDILNSMEELDDEYTYKIISPSLDMERFWKTVELFESKQQGGYFLGQIYHHGAIEKLFQDALEILKKMPPQSPKKLYWFAPDDIYWGAQNGIQNLLELLGNNEQITQDKQKIRLYDFHLYLPLRDKDDRRGKNEWQYRFKNTTYQNNLYGFQEGFLNGCTELIVLEDHFVIVCYHVKSENHSVTLPIGFFVRNIEKANAILNLAQEYIKSVTYNGDDEEYEKDFGRLYAP